MRQNERRILNFVNFLHQLIFELNNSCDKDTVLLVEGKRDVLAFQRIGYSGRVVSVSSFLRIIRKGIKPARKVILMTDLDREGRILASRLVKLIKGMGMEVSIEERRRLLAASYGLIDTIESLSRFAELTSHYDYEP